MTDKLELNELFEAAVRGEIDVPPYQVATRPSDGAFIVLVDAARNTAQGAIVAGDVRRRFLIGLSDDSGRDPFAGMRTPWPRDARVTT